MAASLSSGGGVRGRHGRTSYRPMSEINVTPMVDVMLVLLIIFMVTAPLLTVGIPVDLPKTEAQVMSDQVEPLVITVDGEGRIFLQETEIEPDILVPRLQAITANKLDTRIFVRGDKAIAYGAVIEVMGLIHAAGFTQVALIVELPEVAAPPAGGEGAGDGAAEPEGGN
jgi:biopolymer transport protein TolR